AHKVLRRTTKHGGWRRVALNRDPDDYPAAGGAVELGKHPATCAFADRAFDLRVGLWGDRGYRGRCRMDPVEQRDERAGIQRAGKADREHPPLTPEHVLSRTAHSISSRVRDRSDQLSCHCYRANY